MPWQPPLTAINAELARRSLYEFVRQAWPVIESAPFVDNWHIGAVCEHLQAVTVGQIPKLVINVPPGCSKSLLTCVFWPIWEWASDATVRWFFASYDQRLSTRDSVKCRVLLYSDWYQEQQAYWGNEFNLTGDQNQKTYYETDQGGYRLATSIGGHGTGQHPDRIVVDDPHDVKGAESEAERLAAIEWWDLTMSSRGVSRGARRVIIMQRLHEKDLTGHVLDSDGWEHICLPMRYEPNRMKATSLGWTDPRTEPGELLTPRQFSEKQVADLERSLGSYGTAGQLQQRPVPDGGGKFQRAWFRYYKRSGDYFEASDGKRWGWNTLRRFVTVDLAASQQETADWTVIMAWAVTDKCDLILLDMHRARIEAPEMTPAIRAMLAKWKAPYAILESTGFQLTAVQHARRNGLAVREYTPDRDKVARSMQASIRMEAGQVYFPDANQAPWIAQVETELLYFPNGEHDDIVDNVSCAAIEVERIGERSLTAAYVPQGGGR